MPLPPAKAVLVLLLLSLFVAQLVAPAVHALRRYSARHEGRPIPRWRAILFVYLALAAIGTVGWLTIGRAMTRYMPTAPVAFNRMLAGTTRTGDEVERLAMRLPVSPTVKRTTALGLAKFFRDLDRDARVAVRDLNQARRFAWTLLVVPVVTFVLLNNTPAFRRSALRALPHGHMQWRAEEYLRDVNSALAGYVRAQLAAGVIVGVICAIGFAVLGLPYAGSLGIAAGVLELVPVIGPLTVGLMAAGQAGRSALAVVAFLVALRLVQDYILYPRLIRRGMHLSTIAVILSVWIGAGLYGATGVLVAIPIASFISVSVRHWREYREIERLVRSSDKNGEHL